MSDPIATASAPAVAPRRRYLSILFSDLVDAARLGATLETEQYAAVLAALREACHSVIPHHGGKVVRMQGDGVLAIFGYPEASEDDGRRATEAALELHATVRRLAPAGSAIEPGALAMHTGIHAGLVLLGDGDLELGRFELMGHAPNIAARLLDAAQPDQIVVSEETLGPEAHFFETSQRSYLSLKGAAQPVAVYRVMGRAPVRNRYEARTTRGLSPYVGRQPERMALEFALQETLAGAPRFVAVSAGPGMGKTRLVEEFLGHATHRDIELHRGYCESYLSAEPLQPFLQMLRGLFRLARGMSPADAAESAGRALARISPALVAHRGELLRALSLAGAEAGDPLPGAGDPRKPGAGGVVAALCDLFAALAATRPLLLVIDDWQWADDASRQVLDGVLSLVAPIFVLVATRGFGSEDPAAARATVLELLPLGVEETGQTIARLLPGAAPFVVADIHAYAGGNPLYIEELCHTAAVEGTVRRVGRTLSGAAWLDSLIESRVGRLPEPQAEIVRAAAVIGHMFPAWLLERITGRGEHDPELHALAAEDFIFPTGQAGLLRFKHGLTRDVIYDAVGLHARRAMHLRVAEAIASQASTAGQEDILEALAYHYGAGGRDDDAARYAELAGDKAAAASALDRARSQYRAALDALDRLGPAQHEVQRRWNRVVQKLGLTCVFDPLGLQDAPVLFERGVALARASGDRESLARAEYWLGYVCYAKGRARDAIVHCESALLLATQLGAERLVAQIRATLGQALTSACEYERALALMDEAIAVKRRFGSHGGGRVAVGSAFTLACKGLVLGDRGRFAQAHECFDEALTLIKGADNQVESSVCGWISTVCQWQGRWEQALRTAERAVQIGEQVRSSHLFVISRALAGYSRWKLNGDPAGLRIVAESSAWAEARKGRLFASLYHGWLVDGLVSQGRLDEARRHAARLFVRARELDRLGEALACRALARAAAEAGQLARAERYLQLAMRCAVARGSPHERAATLLCRAEVAALFERREAALAALDAACEGFLAMQMTWHLLQAQALRQQLG